MDTPEKVLSAVDRGDDMQMRVRYQATYTALVGLGMLLDATEIEEIYCEHHEDVLVRKTNGRFLGYQVKTRLASLGPFKADDDPIKSALSRFVGLDRYFPGQFDGFVIASNVGFWQTTASAKNLPYIIQLAMKANRAALKASREVRRFIGELASDQKCKHKVVWGVLARVRLQSELPQFQDIEKQLAVQIATTLNESGRRFDELMKAAKAAVEVVRDASSRNHSSPLFRYFVFMTESCTSEESAIIEAKRISKERLRNAIVQAFDDAVLLCSGNCVDVATLPRGMTKIEKKMAVGGIIAGEIALAKDLKFSIDKLLQEWMYKYGAKEASKRYDHLQLIVKDDCFEASQYAQAAGPYGAGMLARVRSNLKASAMHHAVQLGRMGVTYNHLMGVVGILTEECTLWWSDQFAVMTQDDNDAS